jgi:hypothetical protein
MAIRMLVYVGLLYQELIKGGHFSNSGKLPPVLTEILKAFLVSCGESGHYLRHQPTILALQSLQTRPVQNALQRWRNARHLRAAGFQRQDRRSADHRQDSRSPHEERRITATTRVAAGNVGLTRFRLVYIALGFHASLHGTATQG